MGKLKKGFSLVIICCITFSLLAGCGKPKQGTEEEKEKVKNEEVKNEEVKKEEEPVVLKLFMHSRDMQENSFSKDYIEKATNTKLEITQVTTKELENKLNIILASGDRPDILQYEKETMEAQLLKGNILLPISDFWNDYDNIKKSRPDDIWEVMKHTDGKVYAVGYQTTNPLAIIAYRQDWLDKLNLSVPTTMEEYYEVAKAFAKQDPDGNGKDDTYAFGGYGNIDTAWFDHIFGAFGALPNYWMVKEGQVVNGSVQPEMKEALVLLNKMYTEKLIDPEFVTDDASRWKQKVKAGILAAGVTKLHIFDRNNLQNYYAPFKQKNPDGEWIEGPVLQGVSDHPVGIRMATKRGWLRTSVSKDSKNIDAALRLIDWACSEEGNKFVNYGLEGEHYTVDENGLVKRLIDDNQRNELDIDKFYIAKTALFDHSSPEFIKGSQFTAESAAINPVDGIIIDELGKHYTDLCDLTNTKFISMIIGDTPVNEGFEEFVKEWNKRGGEELTKAMNQAYQERQGK